MTLIASSTVPSGGAASIDFTSIPSTYTDLVVKLSARTTRPSIIDYGAMRFNSDNGSNYTAVYFYGFGTGTPPSNTNGNATQLEIPNTLDGDSATANTFSNVEIYIPNYAGSTQKSVSFDGVSENNATNAITLLQAGKWSGTSAINSMTLYSANGFNFMQYSTAYLYGVKNA
jgi:hypothetical protein